MRRGTLARDGPLTDGMLPEEVAARWGEDAVAEFLHDSLKLALKRMRSAVAQRGSNSMTMTTEQTSAP